MLCNKHFMCAYVLLVQLIPDLTCPNKLQELFATSNIVLSKVVAGTFSDGRIQQVTLP